MNVQATPMSRKDIRGLALELRKMCGAQDILYFPIVHFIEYILSELDGFSYLIVPVEEMTTTYGTTNTEKNVMKIREDVYEGAVKGNPRDRFTLCHELGHYLLHQPQQISFARGAVPKYCDPEWQANTFAGELMAPSNLIQNMTVGEIAEKCGISKTAASKQLKMCHN